MQEGDLTVLFSEYEKYGISKLSKFWYVVNPAESRHLKMLFLKGS